MQARFEEASLEAVEKNLGEQGLPPHLALATAELFGALGFEEPIIFADEIIQASDVSKIMQVTRKYHYWMLMTVRSSRKDTSSNLGELM